jgi:hypothetical protein
LQLRRGETWQPLYKALGLDWVDRGTSSDEMFGCRPKQVVAGMKLRPAAAAQTAV